jgi:DsbC/DsbD-like thiol-disulfide interchange protein
MAICYAGQTASQSVAFGKIGLDDSFFEADAMLTICCGTFRQNGGYMAYMLALRVLSFGLLIASTPGVADPFSTDWASGSRSSARLIAGDGAAGDRIAGVEIKLAPGALTYWRNPGDAGLPPVFSFDGSDNVAAAEPLFPAPQRLKENDGEAFGYDHSVILPIDVTPKDPAKPVVLALKLDYAVCEKICVPAKAALKLPLPATVGSPYAAILAEARAKVPEVIEWAALAERAEIAALDEKTWRLCLPANDGPPRDLFIEAPEQWWFETAATTSPPGKACFIATMQQKPADQTLPVTARLTVTGGRRAFETTVALKPRATP